MVSDARRYGVCRAEGMAIDNRRYWRADCPRYGAGGVRRCAKKMGERGEMGGLCRELQVFSDTVDYAVDFAMEHEVADAVVAAIQGAVETEVYRKYEPRMYERKRDFGGLQDPKNMDRRYDKVTKTLEVQDVRDDPEYRDRRSRNGGENMNVADVVEEGGPYNFRLKPDPGPRPFHSVAEDRLIDQRWADDALQEAMKPLDFFNL